MTKLAAIALLFAGCATTASAAEPVSLSPTDSLSGPWTHMRDVLVYCAQQHGLYGPLTTKITFDRRGRALRVGSAYGDPYAQCVGTAMGNTRFDTQRDRALMVTFTSPSPERMSQPSPQ